MREFNARTCIDMSTPRCASRLAACTAGSMARDFQLAGDCFEEGAEHYVRACPAG